MTSNHESAVNNSFGFEDKPGDPDNCQSVDNPADWIKAGNFAFDSGQLETARDCYIEALDRIQQDKQASVEKLQCLSRLGQVCLALNQPELALDLYARSEAPVERTHRWHLFFNLALLFVIILLIISFNLTGSYLPSNGVSNGVFTKGGLTVNTQFKSADELSALRIADSINVHIWDRGKTWETRYVNADLSFMDCLKLLSGCRRRLERFFITGDNFVIDDYGAVLYSADAPEVLILKRMWWYPGLLNDYYSRFKRYPDSEESWMPGVKDFLYTNPITGKPDRALFVSTTEEKTVTPPEVATPGAVLIITSSKGDSCAICGYDRNARVIGGSVPGKPFAIELKQGITPFEEYLRRIKQVYDPLRKEIPETIVFTGDVRLRALIEGLEFYLPAIVIPVWLASWFVSLMLFKLARGKAGLLHSFGPMIIPTVLLLIVLFMSYGDWLS